MNILYLGYWGVREGLSVATIYPHLDVLSQFPSVYKIIYCSIEREGVKNPQSFSFPKVQHIPLKSPSKFGLLAKVFDFTYFPWNLKKIVERYEVDFLICRGAPAGIIGHLLHSLIKIPYAVESFEPHADYMYESGVWSKGDPRYLIEKWGEKAQKKTANFLLPVADGYRQKLIAEGVPEDKLINLPCTVDSPQFAFNPSDRSRIRKKLGLTENELCGIYVGKFGGLYLDEKAFELFRNAFQQVPFFYLIILSPQDKQELRIKCETAGLPKERVLIKSVSHSEVPTYLSAADFSFALIKPLPSQKFSSPIKIGEYWANGLPVIMPEGIGDETIYINENPELGILLEKNSLLEWGQILKLANAKRRKQIAAFAEKVRGRNIIELIYSKLIANICFTAVEERGHHPK